MGNNETTNLKDKINVFHNNSSNKIIPNIRSSSECKNRIPPTQKIQLNCQNITKELRKKQSVKENICPNSMDQQKLSEKDNQFGIINKKYDQFYDGGTLSNLIQEMTKHSGNTIDDSNEYRIKPLNIHKKKEDMSKGQINQRVVETKLDQNHLKLNDSINFLNNVENQDQMSQLILQDDAGLQFILKNCTQTLSRTDTQFSPQNIFKDLCQGVDEQPSKISKNPTFGTAHFNREDLNSSQKNVTDIQIECKRLSFDEKSSINSIQDQNLQVQKNNGLFYLMESIEQLYGQTSRQSQSSLINDSRTTLSRIFPEESWARKSIERKRATSTLTAKTQIYSETFEFKKINAMLEEPIKAFYVLPQEFSIHNSNEIMDSQINDQPQKNIRSQQNSQDQKNKKKSISNYQGSSRQLIDHSNDNLQYWKLRGKDRCKNSESSKKKFKFQI